MTALAPRAAVPVQAAAPVTRAPRGRGLGLAWLLGAAALTLVVTVQPLRDPDVWWHLAVGRLIASRGIPAAEPFTFAGAPHPWVGQQWLYELGLARIVDLGGAGLAMAAMGVMASLAFFVAALATRRTDAVPAPALAASLLLMALVAGDVLGVRGQVVTVVGTALTLLAVTRWREGSTRWLWALPPILLVWANLHAGFVTGLAVPLAAAATVAVHRRLGGSEVAPVRPLLGVTVLAALATLVNPAGPGLWAYVAQTFTTPTLTSSIVEWQSPDFHATLLRVFEVSAVLLVVLWAVSRRPDPLDVVLALGMLAATLQAQRNVALFAVVATPQLARYGGEALARLRARGARPHRRPARPALPAWPALLLAGLAAAGAVGVDVLPATTASATAAYERDHEPRGAVTYVSTHLSGRHLYSTYEWGGYLADRLGDRRVVWIYGESAVFGEARLQEYLDVHLLRPDWVDVLRRNGMRDAIVPTSSQEAAALLAVGWRVLCQDGSGGALVLEQGAASTPGAPVSDPSGVPDCASA